MSTLDMIMHNDISTVVCIYSLKKRLSAEKYPSLSQWMEAMNKQPFVETNLGELIQIIDKHKWYEDYIKS